MRPGRSPSADACDAQISWLWIAVTSGFLPPRAAGSGTRTRRGPTTTKPEVGKNVQDRDIGNSAVDDDTGPGDPGHAGTHLTALYPLPGGQEHVTVVDGPVGRQDPHAAQPAFAAQAVVHDLHAPRLKGVQHAGADRDLDGHTAARHGDQVRAGGMDTDRDLAVRPFADGSTVLAGHPDRRLTALGNDTSSITHTSGVTTPDSRWAPHCLTHRGSHSDWFTNCCRACIFPSGRPSAIVLDRLAPTVHHQTPKITLTPPPLIPPRQRPEHIGNELRQLAPEPFHFPQPHSGKLPRTVAKG